jgi:hypothetical protein
MQNINRTYSQGQLNKVDGSLVWNVHSTFRGLHLQLPASICQLVHGKLGKCVQKIVAVVSASFLIIVAVCGRLLEMATP